MDPFNPTYEEVLLWGQTDDDLPEQDWDLFLIISLSFLEFDKLISDVSIKEDARRFLIGCLYTLVGDAVRTKDAGLIGDIEAFSRTIAPNNNHLVL